MSGIIGKNSTRGSGAIGTATIGADAVSGANISDDAIDSEHYTDGSIDNAHIADDAIDSEHYADGSIDLAHMSSESVDEDNLHISNTGSNGQFLSKQSGNAGGLTWAAAGGGGSLVLISSSEASGVASIDFTGLDNSTYVMYMMTWEDLVPAVDASDVSFRVGDSGGFDSGASDYDFHRGSLNSGSASYAAGVDAAHDSIVFSGNTGSSTNESANGYMYLYGIGSTTCFTSIHGAFMHRNNAGTGQFGWCGGYRLAAITCDRVQIFFDAGNISTGRVSLYGLAYA